MTEIRALIEQLVAAGVDPIEAAEVVARAAIHGAAQSPAPRTARQERNARYYASKATEKRLKASEQDVSDEDVQPLSPKEIPQTPLEITPYPKTPSPPKGGSFPAGFDRFWDLYPNKVGKPVAAKKFAAALRVASLETIMTGLAAYVAKTDDRPWCNPSTWLHQQRWADQPAEVARGSPAFAKPERPDHFANLAQELSNEQNRSHRSDNRDWDDAQGVPVLAIDYERR